MLSSLCKPNDSFLDAYDKAAVGMGQVAFDGRITWVNRKLCDILGYSREEVMKLAIRDITHPEDLEKAERYFNRLLRGRSRNTRWKNATCAKTARSTGCVSARPWFRKPPAGSVTLSDS